MQKSNSVVWLVVLSQIFLLLAPSALLAQTDVSSEDSFPIIGHDTSDTSFDDQYTFTANVSDNSGIANVTFLYRYSDEDLFREMQMKADTNGSTYSAQLPKADQRIGTLEYYFVVTDDQGNTATEGFVFDPLTRDLVAPSVDRPAASPVSEPVAIAVDSDRSNGKIKPLYIILGVLALGAVASAASSDSSGSGGSCAVEGCSINLLLPPPSN